MDLPFYIIGIGECITPMDVATVVLVVVFSEVFFVKGGFGRVSTAIKGYFWTEIVASVVAIVVVFAPGIMASGAWPPSWSWLLLLLIIPFPLFTMGFTSPIIELYLVSAFLVYLCYRFISLRYRGVSE